MPRLIHVYVLSDDMKYKREKCRRTSLSHPLSVCLFVWLSVSLNSYICASLTAFFTIQNMYIYFFSIQNIYMHAYTTLPNLGAKRLGGNDLGESSWGNGIGGETTRVWGRNDQG